MPQNDKIQALRAEHKTDLARTAALKMELHPRAPTSPRPAAERTKRDRKARGEKVPKDNISTDPAANAPPPRACDVYKQRRKAQEEEVPEEDTVKPDPRVARIKMLIRGVYERQNPAKLHVLKDLLNKYAGSEGDVYVRVCQRYGETPEQILWPRHSP